MLIFFVIVHRLFLWKTKKALTNALQDILHGPCCKRNKICIDHGGKFCIKLMKTWLEGTIIEIYSMYEENLLMFMGIRTQSTNMTAISKKCAYWAFK